AVQLVAPSHGVVAHLIDPRPAVVGDVHVGADAVDGEVEELLLAGDVVVERHRGDADLVGEPTHGDRTDAVALDQRQRRLEDLLARERYTTYGVVALGKGSIAHVAQRYSLWPV